MRVTGKIPPDIALLLGKCEICGEQATSGVQDFLEIEDFTGRNADQIEKLGGLHRFCDEHNRESKFVRIIDDTALWGR